MAKTIREDDGHVYIILSVLKYLHFMVIYEYIRNNLFHVDKWFFLFLHK